MNSIISISAYISNFVFQPDIVCEFIRGMGSRSNIVKKALNGVLR